MATTPQNNYDSDSLGRVQAPISSAQAINQGDLVKIASNLAVPVDTPATDVVFGMADDTNPVVSLLDTLTQIKVIRSGIVRLVLKSGDVLAYDAKVYIGVDAQTVTVTDPGGATAVGRSRELSSVTGDGSIRVKIDLNVRSNA